MKKLVLLVVLFAFVASGALAATFQPEVMKISAPTAVKYDFDGKELSIPVTVTGPGGSAYFLVFTKDKGASIGKVVNGFLGWHEINKIDTCIYLSPATSLSRGSNTVKWTGKDTDGGMVGAGDYTYYIWAIDTNNVRTLMTKQVTFSAWKFRTWATHDSLGVPFERPVVYPDPGRKAIATLFDYTLSKWTVGNDPEDATLKETSIAAGYSTSGGIAWDDNKYKDFFFNTLTGSDTWVMRKYNWVPNGVSVLQTKWGTDGEFKISVNYTANQTYNTGVVNIGSDMLIAANGDMVGTSTVSEIYYVDRLEGIELKRFDMSPWWVDLNDFNAKGQVCGGPTELWLRNGMIFLGGHGTCVNMMWDPFYEEDADAVKWVNTNGDYVGDHNYQAADKPWVCNDYNVGPYKYCISADANMFSAFPSFDMGAVSFGLYAPDGTGINYVALAGETAFQKMGADFVDYGSAYDGFYTTSNVGRTTAGLDSNMWYVAHDSVKGVISNKVGVADAAPAAFSVAQNSPNPFNPTTTIKFSIPKAGKVSVEVFNVAGQKIDTLVNGVMTPGSHTVTWNASKYSAGMYFYTVKADGFSKTLKMTLLK